MALPKLPAWQEGFACQVSATQHEQRQRIYTPSIIRLASDRTVRGEAVSVWGNPDRKTAASNVVASERVSGRGAVKFSDDV